MSQPPYGEGQWALYDVDIDPSESVDLADAFPQVVAELLRHWDAYVAENGVVVTDMSAAGSR